MAARTLPGSKRLIRDYEWKGRVGESPQTLAEVFEFEKALDLKIERALSLRLAATGGGQRESRISRADRAVAKSAHQIGEAFAFFRAGNPGDRRRDVRAVSGRSRAGDWRIKLKKIRRMKPHVLSEEEERLLALGECGARRLRRGLLAADRCRHEIRRAPRRERARSGRSRKVPSLLSGEARSRVAETRVSPVLRRSFRITSSRSRRPWPTRSRPMSFARAREIIRRRSRRRSFSDDVPVAVYDGLIAAVRENLAPLFRYYDLRRRVLSSTSSIITTPMCRSSPRSRPHVTFDEAIENVLAALRRWARYVEALGEGLRGRWCDRYENKGKRSGAFSSGSYGAPPYILMNYKERCFLGRLHARARGRAFHAHLVRAAAQALSGLRLSDFPGRGGLHLQRRTADPSSCSRRRPTRRCAPTSSTGRSMTFAARSSGKRCSPSLRRSSMRSRKAANR